MRTVNSRINSMCHAPIYFGGRNDRQKAVCFSEAPPTRPVDVGWAAECTLSAVTLPPYESARLPQAANVTRSSSLRRSAWTSRPAGRGTTPVPIAIRLIAITAGSLLRRKAGHDSSICLRTIAAVSRPVLGERSPTQTTGVRPLPNAARVAVHVVARLLKICRRSLCPE